MSAEGSRRQRSVKFNKESRDEGEVSKAIKEYDRHDLDTEMANVKRITAELVAFMGKRVEEHLIYTGQHMKGEEDSNIINVPRYNHFLDMELKKVIQGPLGARLVQHSDIADTLSKVLEYWDKSAGNLYHDLFEMKREGKSGTRAYLVMKWAAMTIMLIGMGAFFEYGHCMNKCATVIDYKKDEFAISYTDIGKTEGGRDLAEMCIESHRDIEDAMAWDDIRDLDEVFQDVSGLVWRQRCSLVFPVPELPGDRVGPLPGAARRLKETNDFVKVGEQLHRVFVNRRGVKYIQRQEGMFELVDKSKVEQASAKGDADLAEIHVAMPPASPPVLAPAPASASASAHASKPKRKSIVKSIRKLLKKP